MKLLRAVVVGVCVSAAAASMPQAANASVAFQLGALGSGWELGSGWGAELNDVGEAIGLSKGGSKLAGTFLTNPLLGLVNFSLDNVGDSNTFLFGSITLNEAWIVAAEANSSNLGVIGTLAFILPDVDGVGVTGTTQAVTGAVSDSAEDVTITFEPTVVSLADGSSYSVDLSDISLSRRGLLGTAIVDATVTLLSEPTPEPASCAVWTLLGLAGFVGRRRWKRVA